MHSRRIQRRTEIVSRDGLEGMPPVLARVFAARGVSEAADLANDLRALIPVSSWESLTAAVRLLLRHRELESPVTVVGDFDADGATSTALVVRTLRCLGFGDVDFVVPNRFEFGYGLTPELVAIARQRSPGLIITVDNGVSSVAGVAAARDAGFDVLITDHHLPPTELPDAQAIVNPNLVDEDFPAKNLAGVGVAFYLMAALTRQLVDEQRARQIVARSLDLVALGTVADVVPLDRNNRILVEQGLRRIRAGRCVPGITELLKIGRRDPTRVVASDLGFTAGPRLNAAGRLDDMATGIRCLLTDDPAEAVRYARILDSLNSERREIEAHMQDQAMQIVEEIDIREADSKPFAFCLYGEDWHQGVVGLVASRIKDKVHRPVIAFADEDDIRLKGSARSIRGLHIRDVLAEIDARKPGLIRKFGGHAMAAGLTLDKKDLDRFRQELCSVAKAHLDDDMLDHVLMTDGMLEPEELTLETALSIRDAGPWGQAFPEPSFDGTFTIDNVRVMKEKHLRLRVRPAGEGKVVEAVAFNQAHLLEGRDPAALRLVYRADVNRFRGVSNLQLIVEHMEPVEDFASA